MSQSGFLPADADRPELLPRQASLEPVPLAALCDEPLISIVIPSFNQGKYIRDTLESILQQAYRRCEVIVMDGGSTDETISVLQSYAHVPEIRWVSERDRGVVHAVNKGLAAAQGDLVAIQSSDDVYCPQAFEHVIAQFLANPGVGMVYGQSIKIDAQGRELGRYPSGAFSLENVFLMKTWIPQPATFFRRELLDVVGGWDDRIPYTPDTDLYIRLAFRTQVIKLNEYLSRHRAHPEQRDNQHAKIVDCYCRMIDQSPDVARASEEVRRAAMASKYLIRTRYPGSASSWATAGQFLQAGLTWPAAWNGSGFVNAVTFPAKRIWWQTKTWVKSRWQPPLETAAR
jgi:glycosyltransferase involved in cell wall biosynthesis